MTQSDEKATPKATELARVFPDHPLREETLQFEFEGFARTLAELAWNPDNGTPFTVVVRGGWGRGKTTLLRRAQWMLEHPETLDPQPPEGIREVRTLWFNAWKYPDDDTVLAGLLGAAIDGLAEGDKLDQLKRLVASYKSGTLKALFALAAPAPLRDFIVDGAEDKFQPVHEKRAFHDTFRKLFNEASRLHFELAPAFRDTGGLSEEQLWSPDTQRRQVLAVFLDDLDRCRRERVVEVIEAINLFLDLPGVCFFLGIDWDRLVDVLPEAVLKRDQGNEFLEKVVQVAFDLPEVSPRGAEEYVSDLLPGSALAAVLGVDGRRRSKDVRILAQVLATRHPRHVKRFLNDLSLSLAVLRNTGKLGEGDGKLPEPAVVAWHLLSETLPADRWREVRALPQNLRKFLQDMERLEAQDGKEEGTEVPQEWHRIRASGLLKRHLKTLRELKEGQRHLLVYLATPPVVEVAKGRRSTRRIDMESLDLVDPSSAAWVEIPGGSFWMGAQNQDPDAPGYDPEAQVSESPVRQVTVSPFRLARYPITNGQYAAFVQKTGKEPPEHWEEGQVPEGKAEHPVVYVSWRDAVAFCEWISRCRDGEEVGVRLPTEAEWEFAARGEAARKYPWGKEEPTAELANFGRYVGDTTPVGCYPAGATPEGLEDLAGNVWEWCGDWIAGYPEEPETDPSGPTIGEAVVLRGGSFDDDPGDLRAAYRFGSFRGLRNSLFGFRLAWPSPGGL